MATKHTLTLTCDICKVESNSAYSWARIAISGSTDNLVLNPDQHFDLCRDCWVKNVRNLIYPRRAKVGPTQ